MSILLREKVFAAPLCFINGARFEATGSEKLFVSSPSSGKLLVESKCASPADVDTAVNAAKKAYGNWSALSALERAKYLTKAATKIRELADEIAWIEVLDTGKPVWEAKADVEGCADVLDYYAGLGPSVVGEHVMMPGGSFVYTRREPFGVCVGIGAFNYPFQMAILKSAPALACGNTMVFKPSPQTPLSCLTVAEIYKHVGLPDGVFNVVQGGVESSQALITHPAVRKISFTGSVPVGAKIYTAAAKDLKQAMLELGGKSPLIVFEDANFENAVRGAMLANFMNQGQVCSNGTRVFVQRSIADKFAKEVAERAQKLKIGNPFEKDTMVGATISPDQAKRVLNFIETSKKEGATILCGGDRVEMPEPLSGGWYLSPCVMTGVTDDMTVCREEVFGAVMAVMPFDTEEEIITRANDTDYGLAAGVFSKDIQRAHRVAGKLQSGVVYVNTYNAFPVELPFGGVKKSGMGREGGLASLEFWTQTKGVFVEAGDVETPY